MTCGTDWVKSMILPNFIEVLKIFEVTQGFTEYCTKFHKVSQSYFLLNYIFPL